MTVDGTSDSKALSSVSSLSVSGGSGDDSFTIDSTLASAGIAIAFDGGAGNDTLHGPSTDATWNVTGAGAGNVGGVAFSGFENLAGAADNKDTFVIQAGGSITSVDGGAGGYDALVLAGHPDTVASTPTGAGSGTLVVDGTTTSYTGLEDPDISGTHIVINGFEDGNGSPIPQGDLFKVSPYNDGSTTPTCGTPGNCIQVQNFDALTGNTLDVLNYFVISGTSSLTVNGGPGTDKTEFTGDFIAPNIDLTVNTESIKLDTGVTVSAHDVLFNAAMTDDGTSLVGIDTTLLGDNASIELDSATLTGAAIDLEASATNAKTTIDGDQILTGLGDNLFVATTTPFLSEGEFTIDGLSAAQTCAYTGTSNRNEFTGVTGCIGLASDTSAVDSVGILEDQSLTGFDHAALQLIYGASITIGGSSSITATTGNVTLASSVDVTGTANGKPLGWAIDKSYNKDDVVTFNDKLYKALQGVAAFSGPPDTDTTDWTTADGQNAALAASVLVANAISQLSGTSTISAVNGNVTISANLKTNITTEADATLSSSGAAFAVGVVVTDSEAYVDSTAATPGGGEEPHGLGRHEQHVADHGQGEPGRRGLGRHGAGSEQALGGRDVVERRRQRRRQRRGEEGRRDVEDLRRRPGRRRRARRHRARRDDQGLRRVGGRHSDDDLHCGRNRPRPRRLDEQRDLDGRRGQRQVLAGLADPLVQEPRRHRSRAARATTTK